MPFSEGVGIGAEFIIHFLPDPAGILLKKLPVMMDLRTFLQRHQLKRPEEDLVERAYQRCGFESSPPIVCDTMACPRQSVGTPEC